jgi:hypothetical protein
VSVPLRRGVRVRALLMFTLLKCNAKNAHFSRIFLPRHSSASSQPSRVISYRHLFPSLINHLIERDNANTN